MLVNYSPAPLVHHTHVSFQYIASHLLSINEARTFEEPPPLDGGEISEKFLKQDNEIFERARLVNCGHFMSAILADYIPVILGLNREGSDWILSPLEVGPHTDHRNSVLTKALQLGNPSARSQVCFSSGRECSFC